MSNLDRRTFLTTTALGLLGPSSGRATARRLSRIGLHLGSVREDVAADLSGTLRRIDGLGYLEVEFWVPDGLRFDALDTRRLFDGLGLAAPSRHVRMSDLFSNWRLLLRECQLLGNRHVVCSEIPEQERATLDGYKRVVDLLNAAGKLTQSVGIRLALQHHADDFRPRGGVVPYDYVLGHTDPELVSMQIDLSELARVGRDPLDDFAKYPGRFASVHVNNVAAGREPQPVGLGEGRIDLARILARGNQAGFQYYFVDEQRRDAPWEHAKANFAYLSRLEFD